MNFSNKLKLIKNCYKLQRKEMALILGITYQGFLKYINKQAMPGFDKVVELSNYFCISLDWIGGTTNCPYNEEQILSKEKELFTTDFEIYQNINGEKHKIFPIICNIPEDYKNQKQRKQLYTLSTRSNIIYLINRCKKQYIRLECEKLLQKQFNNPQKQFNNPQKPIYNLNAFLKGENK